MYANTACCYKYQTCLLLVHIQVIMRWSSLSEYTPLVFFLTYRWPRIGFSKNCRLKCGAPLLGLVEIYLGHKILIKILILFCTVVSKQMFMPIMRSSWQPLTPIMAPLGPAKSPLRSFIGPGLISFFRSRAYEHQLRVCYVNWWYTWTHCRCIFNNCSPFVIEVNEPVRPRPHKQKKRKFPAGTILSSYSSMFPVFHMYKSTPDNSWLLVEIRIFPLSNH